MLINSSRIPQGTQDVLLQDNDSPIVNLYAHQDTTTPTLTAPIAEDDVTIAVASTTGVVNGHAITIHEGSYFFQSLVKSFVVDTSITLASPVDKAFTASAFVTTGLWNMNLNGSVTPQVFHVRPPAAVNFDIYSITMTMQDDVAMDSAKFGGISALVNGLLIRQANGLSYNLALMVNNHGFAEQGFDIAYDPKAPAGVYGFFARWNIPRHNGVASRVYGASGDEIQFHVRDDLTDLTQITAVVAGHVVVD